MVQTPTAFGIQAKSLAIGTMRKGVKQYYVVAKRVNGIKYLAPSW